MIVRIQGEGQFRLSSALLDQINELDNRLVDLVAHGTAEDFQFTLNQMLALVRGEGQALANDELVESHVVLPPSDISIEEARDLFVGEGLVPG